MASRACCAHLHPPPSKPMVMPTATPKPPRNHTFETELSPLLSTHIRATRAVLAAQQRRWTPRQTSPAARIRSSSACPHNGPPTFSPPPPFPAAGHCHPHGQNVRALLPGPTTRSILPVDATDDDELGATFGWLCCLCWR